MAAPADRMLSRRTALALAALLLACHALANSPWDSHPTPLDRMAAAGIPPDPALLANALNDRTKSGDFRFTAALALAQLDARAHLPDLVAALDDPDATVVQGALVALYHMPDPATVPPACKVLRLHAEPSVRTQAVAPLMQATDDSARRCLIAAAADTNESYEVRWQVLVNLHNGARDHPDNAGLTPVLDDANATLRTYAGLILARQHAGHSASPESLSVARSLARTILDDELDAMLYRQAVDELEVLTGQNFTAFHWNKERDAAIPVDDTRTIAERIADWLGTVRP